MYPVLKRNSCVSIQYSYSYLDAINEGRVIEFLFKNQDVGKLSENYSFIQSIKEAVSTINKKGEKILESV